MQKEQKRSNRITFVNNFPGSWPETTNDDERGFACGGDKLGFLLSMPSLRLMFQFIKIHKTAEVPHCQDEYGASGNPIDDSIIAVNKLTVFFQPDRRHGSARFGMALQFRNGTNQA